jgi:hypothetical protein
MQDPWVHRWVIRHPWQSCSRDYPFSVTGETLPYTNPAGILAVRMRWPLRCFVAPSCVVVVVACVSAARHHSEKEKHVERQTRGAGLSIYLSIYLSIWTLHARFSVSKTAHLCSSAVSWATPPHLPESTPVPAGLIHVELSTDPSLQKRNLLHLLTFRHQFCRCVTIAHSTKVFFLGLNVRKVRCSILYLPETEQIAPYLHASPIVG